MPESLAPDTGVTRSVFVYGTLKPGEKYAHVAEAAGAFRHREGYVDGFVLYHLEPEGYPAIAPSPLGANPSGRRVFGVLLTYLDITTALSLLDDFEGLHDSPPHYVRQHVSVGPRGEEAWVYTYARLERLQHPGASAVPSGVWTGVALTGRE
jgi:gamma-glutamylcyclotransferase (GGCT)/AIG2-like uncharacterized protein YtfP